MAKDTPKENLTLVPIQFIKSRALFSAPVSELSAEQAIEVWSILDIMEKKVISERKSEIKDYYMEYVRKNGVPDKAGKGHRVVEVAGGNFTRQRRSGKVTINSEAFMDSFLEDATIMNSVARYSVNLTLRDLNELKTACRLAGNERLLKLLGDLNAQLDETAFEALVVAGVISPEDAKACIIEDDPTWAFVVKKPSSMKELEKAVKERMASFKSPEELTDGTAD